MEIFKKKFFQGSLCTLLCSVHLRFLHIGSRDMAKWKKRASKICMCFRQWDGQGTFIRVAVSECKENLPSNCRIKTTSKHATRAAKNSRTLGILNADFPADCSFRYRIADFQQADGIFFCNRYLQLSCKCPNSPR